MTNDAKSYRLRPGGSIFGALRVPGDKSMSHRAVIFGSLAKGVTRVEGFLEGEDAMNTVAAFREMGVTIVGPDSGRLTIYGVGMQGLKAPRAPLYMGNSGTALRLLAGLLAAQPAVILSPSWEPAMPGKNPSTPEFTRCVIGSAPPTL